MAQETEKVIEKDDKQLVQHKETEIKKAKWGGVKTTMFTDPNTMEKYPIPVSMSPMPTVDRILTYLSKTGFCGILCIGMSGTGKTTLVRYLIHQLHEKKNFVLHYYDRNDIQKMTSHIENLQSGLDHILFYDDASFALEQLSKTEILKIAQNLTYIRHQTKGKVIVFLSIHYSKAISRFFRNVPFAILTSITMEEVASFQDVWPHGRYKFKDFAWYFQQMMFNSYWRFEVDRWRNKFYKYETDKPFRLSLALEGNAIHYMVYLKQTCAICDPKKGKPIASQGLVDHYVQGYGENRARAMLRLYSFAKHGLNVIDTNRLSIWKSISEFDKNNKIDWLEVNKLLDEQTTKRRRRHYIKKTEYNKQLDQLNEDTKIREELQDQQQFNEETTEAIDNKKSKKDSEDPQSEDQSSDLLDSSNPDSFNYDPSKMPYGYEDTDKQNKTDTNES